MPSAGSSSLKRVAVLEHTGVLRGMDDNIGEPDKEMGVLHIFLTLDFLYVILPLLSLT